MAEQPTVAQQSTAREAIVKSAGPSSEIAATEHRQAYGTAKTENLRDSGLWRLILPAFVLVLCLSLLAVPLIILVQLLITSLETGSASQPFALAWLWIGMIVVIVAIVGVIISGLIRIFFTQAENYEHVK